MLEVNNSVVSNLELDDLFQAISTSLRRVVRHDSASLLLPDPQKPDMLRIHALDFPEGRGFLQRDMQLSIDGTNPGKAFRTGEPILVGSGPGYVPFTASGTLKVAAGEGLRSSMILPLAMNGAESNLGVLALGSRTESAFSQADLDFFGQVAQQIAIGVRNALEHRKLSESAARVSEQKSYLEDEIRAEQDFEDIVGYSPALRHVLQQVETVAPTDSTVLIRARPVPARNSSPAPFTTAVRGANGPSSRLTAPRFPWDCWKASCSAMKKARLPGPSRARSAALSWPTRARCSSTRSETCPWSCSRSCCAFAGAGVRATGQQLHPQSGCARNRGHQSQPERNGCAERFPQRSVLPSERLPHRLPPLRERAEDIPLLARYFTSKYARRMNRPVQHIPIEALEAMTRYSWPGNVRELQNFIERAVILSSDGEFGRRFPN